MKEDAAIERQETVKKEFVEDKRIGESTEPIKVDEVTSPSKKFAFPDEGEDDEEEEGQ